jgi:hypothetical protein
LDSLLVKHEHLTNENNIYIYTLVVFKIGFRWRALVNAIMNLRVPQIEGSFLIIRGPVSFSEKTLLHGVSYRCAELQLEIYILAITNFR